MRAARRRHRPRRVEAGRPEHRRRGDVDDARRRGRRVARAASNTLAVPTTLISAPRGGILAAERHLPGGEVDDAVDVVIADGARDRVAVGDVAAHDGHARGHVGARRSCACATDRRRDRTTTGARRRRAGRAPPTTPMQPKAPVTSVVIARDDSTPVGIMRLVSDGKPIVQETADRPLVVGGGPSTPTGQANLEREARVVLCNEETEAGMIARPPRTPTASCSGPSRAARGRLMAALPEAQGGRAPRRRPRHRGPARRHRSRRRGGARARLQLASRWPSTRIMLMLVCAKQAVVVDQRDAQGRLGQGPLGGACSS